MRVFALRLGSDIKGLDARKAYVEGLVAKLPSPDLVVLPELALCSYMASQDAWAFVGSCGCGASTWVVDLAERYGTYI